MDKKGIKQGVVVSLELPTSTSYSHSSKNQRFWAFGFSSE